MNKALVLLAFLVITTQDLSAQKVGYNYDKQADFSQFETYRWADIGEADSVDEITRQQIRAAIDSQLALKGLHRVDDTPSDLAIGFQVSLSQERQLSTMGTGWGYGPGWGSSWYGYGYGGAYSTTTMSSTITVGTLALDMYDASQKRLVWRGVATKTVDRTSNPQKREKRLNKAAKKLLQHYPSSGK
jgi:Domain of unknown function (DUF4136)